MNKMKTKVTEKNTQEPDDPEEYMSHFRSIFEETLSIKDGSFVQSDIHQNIREIRAILRTNSEIFERCMTSVMSFKGETRVRRNINTADTTSFSRSEITAVHTLYSNEKTVFVVYPKQSTKTFQTSILSNIPDCLKIMLVPKYHNEPHSKYINYEAFFRRSLVLHNDILAPVLSHLKEHLMSVQVCLGQVEEWIMEPHDTYRFLESTFGTAWAPADKSKNEPQKTNGKLCNCPVGKHDDEERCLTCRHPFRKHSVRFSPGFNGDETCSYICPHISECFHCREPESLVLKEIVSSGRHTAKFDVAIDSERSKLKKFLDYIQS